jgi:hypothetical protein
MGGVWFEPKTTRSQEMERLQLHHFTVCDGWIVVFFYKSRFGTMWQHWDGRVASSGPRGA